MRFYLPLGGPAPSRSCGDQDPQDHPGPVAIAACAHWGAPLLTGPVHRGLADRRRTPALPGLGGGRVRQANERPAGEADPLTPCPPCSHTPCSAWRR